MLLSEETKRKIGAARIGKPHTAETKQRISESLAGRVHSEETKQKMSDSHKKRERRATFPSKPVDQYDMNDRLVASWVSIKAIEATLGYDHTNIRKCCNGKRSSVNGFKWKFSES